MKTKAVIEYIVYAIVIVLCLASLLAMWVLPPGVIDARLVYKGF